MDITIEKRYPISANAEQAWQVLSDISATAGCMPGAAITEQLDDAHYKGTVKSKVGPATMTFNGDIEVLSVDADSRTLKLLGKGVDRSGSSASMALTASIADGSPESCELLGHAVITVSGRLAQFGGRLLMPIADMMLAQFANNFSSRAAAIPKTDSVESPKELTDGESAPAGEADTTTADTGTLSHDQTQMPAAQASPAPQQELNALALLWALVKGWIAGLFGKKG